MEVQVVQLVAGIGRGWYRAENAAVFFVLQRGALRDGCLLPGDRLAAAGLNAEAVISAPMAPALSELCAEMAAEGLEALRTAPRDVPKALIAAALPVVLAARDLRRLAEGKEVPAPRGVVDRVAVIWAGWRGRV